MNETQNQIYAVDIVNTNEDRENYINLYESLCTKVGIKRHKNQLREEENFETTYNMSDAALMLEFSHETKKLIDALAKVNKPANCKLCGPVCSLEQAKQVIYNVPLALKAHWASRMKVESEPERQISLIEKAKQAIKAQCTKYSLMCGLIVASLLGGIISIFVPKHAAVIMLPFLVFLGDRLYLFFNNETYYCSAHDISSSGYTARRATYWVNEMQKTNLKKTSR